MRRRAPRRLRAPAAAGALLLATLAAPSAARAADPAGTEGSVPYAVPESPAFTYLGATPALVSRPGTSRDLAVGLLSGIGREGQVNQGIAVDVRPWFLVPGVSIPLDRYRDSPAHYIAANAQLSLGTVRSTPGADPMMPAGDTDIALGIRLTVFDDGDPMRFASYTDALGKALLGCAPPGPGASTPEQQTACLRGAADELRKRWLDEHWNATRLSVGWALGWRAPGSLLGDARWLGHSLWVTAGYGLGGWAQVIGQARYDRNRTLDAHELSFGARANVGSGSVNGFVELLGRGRPGAPAGVDAFDGNCSAGVELLIAARTWIASGFGRSFATEGRSDPIVVLAGLRWAVSDEARLRPRP